jgi:hypothetical protein
MRGLPDSAVYGSYRRLSGGVRRRAKSQVSILDVITEWLEGYEERIKEEQRIKEIRGY